MYAVLRFISLLLIVAALMLLGADIISTLEKNGQFTVRSIEQVWAMLSKSSVDGFKAWLEHTMPTPMPSWIEAILRVPAWGFVGVLGVIFAFLFGRRTSEA
jgi:hypothetical protein